jgi:hypothetical protein
MNEILRLLRHARLAVGMNRRERGTVVMADNLLLALIRLLAGDIVELVRRVGHLDGGVDRDAGVSPAGGIVVGAMASSREEVWHVASENGLQGGSAGGQEGNVDHETGSGVAHSVGLVVIVGAESLDVDDQADDTDHDDAVMGSIQSGVSTNKGGRKTGTYIPPAPRIPKAANFCLLGIWRSHSMMTGIARIQRSVKMAIPLTPKKKWAC